MQNKTYADEVMIKLDGLIKQATEKSHYYVAGVTTEAFKLIDKQQLELQIFYGDKK